MYSNWANVCNKLLCPIVVHTLFCFIFNEFYTIQKNHICIIIYQAQMLFKGKQVKMYFKSNFKFSHFFVTLELRWLSQSIMNDQWLLCMIEIYDSFGIKNKKVLYLWLVEYLYLSYHTIHIPWFVVYTNHNVRMSVRLATFPVPYLCTVRLNQTKYAVTSTLWDTGLSYTIIRSLWSLNRMIVKLGLICVLRMLFVP